MAAEDNRENVKLHCPSYERLIVGSRGMDNSGADFIGIQSKMFLPTLLLL